MIVYTNTFTVSVYYAKDLHWELDYVGVKRLRCGSVSSQSCSVLMLKLFEFARALGWLIKC